MTYKNFTVETDADGIALVTWDMPDKSMNVFTEEVMDELDKIIDQVAGDDAIKGAVLTSGKKDSFSGGADITMLKRMFEIVQTEKAKNPQKAVEMLFEGAGRMSAIFRKLETCGKPWVSAINGTCMGGALEVSLACHGRVAADSKAVKMALPEVKIGIFPGAGGTQRVPRLVNQQDALQMMTQGTNLSPSRAKAMGLIHEVVEPKKLIRAPGDDQERPETGLSHGTKRASSCPAARSGREQGGQLWPAASASCARTPT
jgi:3-hydroxyacyl-CoA dehydrogenase/enoyl-CoA hydratase/3-hydroxybutyryl-CoA epimerase